MGLACLRINRMTEKEDQMTKFFTSLWLVAPNLFRRSFKAFNSKVLENIEIRRNVSFWHQVLGSVNE